MLECIKNTGYFEDEKDEEKNKEEDKENEEEEYGENEGEDEHNDENKENARVENREEGYTNVITHSINTGDTVLIKQTYYRATYKEILGYC
ncbi:4373_t:CDS:2 [Racocetra fulgida]|uniref:4373_t:CDS:1 n=1 Tax=Racocetra fulgida TaxID=60492 RepID=A0A9N8ZGE3_9GLOM|nr:4373_t:CDS:2 [Racocetra fulgida]